MANIHNSSALAAVFISLWASPIAAQNVPESRQTEIAGRTFERQGIDVWLYPAHGSTPDRVLIATGPFYDDETSSGVFNTRLIDPMEDPALAARIERENKWDHGNVNAVVEHGKMLGTSGLVHNGANPMWTALNDFFKRTTQALCSVASRNNGDILSLTLSVDQTTYKIPIRYMQNGQRKSVNGLPTDAQRTIQQACTNG